MREWESYANAASGGRENGRVDANDLTLHVKEWPSRVTSVD